MSLRRYFSLLVVVFVGVYTVTRIWNSDTHRSSVTLREALVDSRQFAGKAENPSVAEKLQAKKFAVVAAEKLADQANIQGADPDWFFLVRELRQISAGRFWTQPWEEVAQNQTDPLPSMLEFQNLLAEKGIKLVVLPVPGKAVIYPEKLDPSFAAGDAPSLSPLMAKFRDAGLNVIDLEEMLIKRREAVPGDKLFCAQDAHFSPLACELIADYLYENFTGWPESKGESELHRSPAETISIVGDQVVGTDWESGVEPETLSVRYAGRKAAGKIHPVQPDSESPILLLGDSHTLVFQEGEMAGMHCRGAGLFDHLSANFGFPIDLVGVRGSGLVQARKSLYYHASSQPDYWKNKKVVIWVFSSREFTQSTDRIISIPIEKK